MGEISAVLIQFHTRIAHEISETTTCTGTAEVYKRMAEIYTQILPSFKNCYPHIQVIQTFAKLQ